MQEVDTRSLLGLAVSAGCGIILGWLLKSRSSAKKNSSLDLTDDTKAFSNMGVEYRLMLVVNSSLKMGRGKVSAQCAHAAVGCYRQLLETDSRTLCIWENYGQPKVVVKAEDTETLKELEKKAKKLGLNTVLIRDAGRTQIAPGSITVLGIGPGPQELIDEVTGHLKLL